MTHDTQPSLLTWRAEETTSGPRSPASDGERTAATPAERWGAFTRAHPDIAAWVLAEARDALARGEKRVSTKALIERARALFRVAINNNAARDRIPGAFVVPDRPPFVPAGQRALFGGGR